jgi:hypothetical protein
VFNPSGPLIVIFADPFENWRGYHLAVNREADQAALEHDASLIRWMLTLTPQQRLHELESRLDFILKARRHGPKLSDNSVDVPQERRW